MDIDKREKEQLKYLMNIEKPDQFGPSFVQRNLRIGYNNACCVLKRGVETGVLRHVKDREFLYEVAP